MTADRRGAYRLAWVAFGLVLAAVLAGVAYAFLGSVVLGIFLYYAARPFHERIRRRVGQPTVAATLAVLALIVPLLVLVVYAVGVALGELQEFLAETDLGPYGEMLTETLGVPSTVEDPAALVGDPGAIVDALLAALDYAGLVGSGLMTLFIAISLAFYLLRDSQRVAGYAALVRDDDGVLGSYGAAVHASLQTVYFGNILTVLLSAVIGAVAFTLVNLAAPDAFAIPYPALLGILTGAASLVPVVGMKIVYVPMLGYLGVRAATTGTGWGFVALAAAVTVVVVDLIPDLLLRPYVSGGELHTGTVMFAYVVGPILWGWYGLFLGPLVLVLLVHFARIVLPELLAGVDLKPGPTDPSTLAGTDGRTDADEEGDGTDAEADPVPDADETPDESPTSTD